MIGRKLAFNAGMIAGFVAALLGGLGAMGAIAASDGCTPAERQVIVTDVSRYGGGICTVIDIVAEALSGVDEPAIAIACSTSEDAIVALLDALGVPADDAGVAQIATSAKIASTKAYRTAELKIAVMKGRR
jgi:hypothetical protein